MEVPQLQEYCSQHSSSPVLSETPWACRDRCTAWLPCRCQPAWLSTRGGSPGTGGGFRGRVDEVGGEGGLGRQGVVSGSEQDHHQTWNLPSPPWAPFATNDVAVPVADPSPGQASPVLGTLATPLLTPRRSDGRPCLPLGSANGSGLGALGRGMDVPTPLVGVTACSQRCSQAGSEGSRAGDWGGWERHGGSGSSAQSWPVEMYPVSG